MTAQKSRTRRKRSKTWSSFGDIKRKPSEYEIVTHGMNHTWGGEGEPLEMGPEVHGNRWLKTHRDAHLFGVENWNDFRDPDTLTYRKYCEQQNEEETYLDGAIKNLTVVKLSDARLSDKALQFLRLVWTPGRYMCHGQYMLVSYLQQMAPSTYVANCATFQTADTFRHVERISYRTKQLDIAHPAQGFGTNERDIWENDPGWQPIRRSIEQALTKYDFDEAFVTNQLIIRPILDAMFLDQFAEAAASLGAVTDSSVAENLSVDSQRAARWSSAMTRFVISQNSENHGFIGGMISERKQLAEELIQAGSRLLARYATIDTGKVEDRVRNSWTGFLKEAGLG